MAGEEIALSHAQIAKGYTVTCGALGNQSELPERELSVVGDERWHRPEMIAFEQRVQKRARLIQRNSTTGQRGAEEYGKPLDGSALAPAMVADLVHTKSDGTQFVQLLASQQPLKQLEKMVPHGFRQEKLFEVLIQHKVPLPRALWLVQIIYLSRPKQSSSQRLRLWTADICQYFEVLLRKGFITCNFSSRGGEFYAEGRRQTSSSGRNGLPSAPTAEPCSELESLKEKWSYMVALSKWSISANILDKELFLTSMIRTIENSHISFGDKRVSAVIGTLLPIMMLMVSFAKTSHRLTRNLANLCTSILQQDGSFATAAAASKDTFLDIESAASVLEILHCLMWANPDAFVVLKVQLPSLDEIGHKYPGLQISESFASGVKYIQARIESLKRIETPSEISCRALEIVLVLDQMMGAVNPNLIMESFITTSKSPAFSKENPHSEQENSLRALVHITCDWAMSGSSSGDVHTMPSTQHQTVACKALKILKQAAPGNARVNNNVAGTTASKPCDMVEASIYSWLLMVHSTDTGYDSRKFLWRSELLDVLFKNGVTSLEGLTTHLILDGTMEGGHLKYAPFLIIFYGAIILRFMPSQDTNKNSASIKLRRGTCTALLESARSTLKTFVVESGEASCPHHDEIFRPPPSEEEIKAEVDALVSSSVSALTSEEEGFKNEERVLSLCSSLHPYIQWSFANEFSKAAATHTVRRSLFRSAFRVMQALGYLAPLLNLLIDIYEDAKSRRGNISYTVLSHMLDFESELILAKAPDEVLSEMKRHAAGTSWITFDRVCSSQDNNEKADEFRKVLSKMPTAGVERSQVADVGQQLADICGGSVSSAFCASKALMMFYAESLDSHSQEFVGTSSLLDLQVMLVSELMSCMALHSDRDRLLQAVTSGLLVFCEEYVNSFSIYTEGDATKLSQRGEAISSLLLHLISEGFIPFKYAVQVLIPLGASMKMDVSKAFWIMSLFGLHRISSSAEQSKWETLSLSSAQHSISPMIIFQILVMLAASVSEEKSQPLRRSWTSILSALCERDSIRKAFLSECASGNDSIDKRLMRALENCFPKLGIDIIRSNSIAHVLLKAFNGESLNEIEDGLNQRAFDVLSCLQVSKLSFQVAEMKLLYQLMCADAEAAIRGRHQRAVDGARDQAVFQVNEQLSNEILNASSRNPSSAVLIAEVVLFLGEELAGATLRRLQTENGGGHDRLGIITLTFLTRGRLSRLAAQTAKYAIGQLANLIKRREMNRNEQQASREFMWKQLKLLVPLLACVLASKELRQELATILLELLSGKTPTSAEDTILALCCILAEGYAPPWHTYYKHQMNQRNGQVLPLPVPPPESLAKLRPVIQSRLIAGFCGGGQAENSFAIAPSADAQVSEIEPLSLLAGCGNGESTAAHWLMGTVRVARSSTLL